MSSSLLEAVLAAGGPVVPSVRKDAPVLTTNPFDALAEVEIESVHIKLNPGKVFSSLSPSLPSAKSTKSGEMSGALSSFNALGSSISDMMASLDDPKKSATSLDLTSMMKPIEECAMPEPSLSACLKSAVGDYANDSAVLQQRTKGGKAQSKRLTKRQQRAAQRATGYADRCRGKAEQMLKRRARLKQKKR